MKKIHYANIFGAILLLLGIFLFTNGFYNAIGPALGFQWWSYFFLNGLFLMFVGVVFLFVGNIIILKIKQMKKIKIIILVMIIIMFVVLINFGFYNLSIMKPRRQLENAAVSVNSEGGFIKVTSSKWQE